MNDKDIKAVSDEALRKIGRNLVHFQKMEHALKIIISSGKISGTASELENAQKKRAKSIEKRGMGSLAKDFMKDFLSVESTF